MLDKNLIPREEIDRLQTKEYSKRALGLNFALFETNSIRTMDRAGRRRYWSEPLNNRYYVCNDWWKGKIESLHEPLFATWIKRIIALNP
jgi:hypothetical protein